MIIIGCSIEILSSLNHSRCYMKLFSALRRICVPLAIAAFAVPVYADDPVTVYSARQEHLIKPLFDRFTDETGIEVRYITDRAEPLLARLRAEGRNSPADLLITVDAGNLWQAGEAGVLRATESERLQESIPEHLRDPENRWFGLSVRARTIFYSTERVDPEELSTYADLADPRWEGRLCLRTSNSVYNQSLVATMIATHGVEETEEVVRGWVNNLAAPPFSNDTAQLEAIAAGQCDIGISNTYYYGRLLDKEPDLPVGLHWANQDAEGVHVNVSGAGITRHAKNPEGALRLLEWLASEEVQVEFGAANREYPANPNVEWDPLLQSWGEYEAAVINVAEAGRLQPQAVMLMDRAGWR